MTWTHDASDNAYTQILSNVRCRVWYTSMGNWAAVFTHDNMSTVAYNFSAPEDAKAWCEQQIAKR